MKKLLIAAVIAAAGIGGYIFNQQPMSPPYNVLEYVPADTPIFSGQFNPFPLKDYLSSTPARVTPAEKKVIGDLYRESDPKLKFLLNIFKTYQNQLQTPDALLKTFGLPDKLRAYAYTLGLVPVFKIEVANPQAVWQLLDKNELETGFKHHNGTLQSLNYRAYPLTDEKDPAKLELIVAIDKGLLTVTLNSAFNDQALLATALGLTKAKDSLAASGKIESIRNTHHFTKDSIGFISHMELLKGLTTTDANQLAKQISSLEKQYNKPSPFAAIRNAQCAADFATISKNWPQTVFGYTNLNINAKESTQEVAAIIESKNQTILKALQAIRGYIPEYTADTDHNVVAMGIGLDISQLASSLTAIWHDLQTPSYTCPPLAKLQSEISHSGDSLAMLGMGANMANGIKGLSLAVLDYTITKNNGEPKLENLEALITLSADNPEQIFNSLKMFAPDLQDVQLKANQDINLTTILPLPVELNLTPKLALRGKHLLIYNGEKGKKIADSLATTEVSKNGLYNLSFDLKKIFTPIVTAIELSGETIPQELLFLSDYDARMEMGVDINQQGIIFNSYINTKVSK